MLFSPPKANYPHLSSLEWRIKILLQGRGANMGEQSCLWEILSIFIEESSFSAFIIFLFFGYQCDWLFNITFLHMLWNFGVQTYLSFGFVFLCLSSSPGTCEQAIITQFSSPAYESCLILRLRSNARSHKLQTCLHDSPFLPVWSSSDTVLTLQMTFGSSPSNCNNKNTPTSARADSWREGKRWREGTLIQYATLANKTNDVTTYIFYYLGCIPGSEDNEF